jgi:hypothetical protein
MADHGPPNYIYHHCADIALTNDATTDGGAPTGAGASSSGCALAGPGRPSLPPLLFVLLLLAFALRPRCVGNPLASRKR